MRREFGPSAIVGWLKAPDGTLAGAAFLIGSDVALTCAHVVRDHLQLGKPTPAEVTADDLRSALHRARVQLDVRISDVRDKIYKTVSRPICPPQALQPDWLAVRSAQAALAAISERRQAAALAARLGPC